MEKILTKFFKKDKIIIGTEGSGKWGKKVIEYIFKKAFPYKKITFTNENICDLIIKGPFSFPKLWNSTPKKYIYWSGEPLYCK